MGCQAAAAGHAKQADPISHAPAPHRRLVQQLWERTADGGVLLLVEPGTPAGAGHIQRARAQLLQAAAAAAAAAGGGGPSQAHVVAPCPHDGACPMEGRPSWCHFVQRFQVGRPAWRVGLPDA